MTAPDRRLVDVFDLADPAFRRCLRLGLRTAGQFLGRCPTAAEAAEVLWDPLTFPYEADAHAAFAAVAAAEGVPPAGGAPL